MRSAGFTTALFALLAIAISCGGPNPTVCDDPDGDLFGEGCDRGPDCDETNALRNRDCDLVPPPDCGADPSATGCACLPGTTECYPAPEQTLGVGMCQPGVAVCRFGTWGLCEGSILPGGERCNALDDDCDGLVDEGAQSPCGGCTPGCVGGVWGEGDAPFDEDESLTLTARGWLTLRFDAVQSDTVWVVNSGEDSVSKLSDEPAEEVARYLSGGSEPSRVAVDYEGDAWVLNREFDGIGSLRRIAGDRSRCIDRDDSGDIQTSVDGTTLEDDECILATYELGGVNGIPRALAIDGNRGVDLSSGGDPWVGLFEEQAILHIDSNTGRMIDRIETPGFSPYALAFDPFGTLYGIAKDGLLLRLDRHDVSAGARIDEIPVACFSLYGLTVDANGRVLMTGFECDNATLFDPETERYLTIEIEPSPRGAVVDGELAYVAHTGGRVSELSLSPFEHLRTFDVSPAVDSIGVGVTSRSVWIASGLGGTGGSGLATRLDPGTGSLNQVDVGRAPHTQGDLTGGKLLGEFAPEGSQRHVFSGCDDDFTRWGTLRIASDARGGTIEVLFRHGADSATRESASFETLGWADDPDTSFPLDLPEGGELEVELRLATEARDGAPRVRRVGIEWQCPGPD